jgi:hypothetical protein
MTSNQIVLLAVLGSMAGFTLIWCFTLWAVSLMSGWKRLARRFGDASLFIGEISRFATARVGWGNYSGALHVGASELGIYIAPMWPFRPFHRPLFIPWTEVKTHVLSDRPWGAIRLTFPSAPRASVVFYGRAADRLLPHVPTQ